MALCKGYRACQSDQVDTINRLMEIFTKAANVRTIPPTRNGMLNCMKPKQIPCINLPTSNSRPVMFELTHVDPEGDGYSIHAMASHQEKANFEIIQPSTGVFRLIAEAAVSVPLKISQVKAADFMASLIYCDLGKGTEDAVKLEFDAINISDFDLVK